MSCSLCSVLPQRSCGARCIRHHHTGHVAFVVFSATIPVTWRPLCHTTGHVSLSVQCRQIGHVAFTVKATGSPLHVQTLTALFSVAYLIHGLQDRRHLVLPLQKTSCMPFYTVSDTALTPGKLGGRVRGGREGDVLKVANG